MTRTLRLKVRAESYRWLEAAAIEVNQIRNWCNEISAKAARPYVGKGKWLSGFDLCKLSASAAQGFECIGADTIQRVNLEYALRRRQFKKVKLRFRASRGPRRSLGWVPFKAASLKRKGKAVGEHAGGSVQIVHERFTTRACSSCDRLTGPSGPKALVVRRWCCAACGAEHDRDVNAARNILARSRCRTAVGGNESSSSWVQPSRALCVREARTEPASSAA